MDKSPQKLSKFLSYVLGRKPDEFGLVPDENGFVAIKSLLKALSEEEGYKYVRKTDFNEILATMEDPPIEIQEGRIRAANRQHLSETTAVSEEKLPKLLYTCVRNKAHAHVLEKGLYPADSRIVLSDDENMAKRMGRRKDAEPVTLTVNTQKAAGMGVSFSRFGESLYVTDALPVECFSAPPLPKEKEKPLPKKKKETVEKKEYVPPGSFFPEMEPEGEKTGQTKHERKKKERARDKEKKIRRKMKQKMWDNK